MYLSVQKIIGSKKYQGNFKLVEPSESSWSINGIPCKKYGYEQTGGRFERENIFYKFVVKNSTHENDNVRQVQFVLGKIDWGVMDSPGDAYGELLNKKKLDFIKSTFQPTEGELEQLINQLDTEIKQCAQLYKSTYQQTEEAAVTKLNRRRINQWVKAKSQFEKQFGVGYFELIYSFNLELMNSGLLEQLKEKKRQEGSNQQSHYESSGRSHSDDGYQSHPDDSACTTYSEAEKDYLKKFYKTLAKNYHPDVSNDDGQAMQLLNKLKEQWKL